MGKTTLCCELLRDGSILNEYRYLREKTLINEKKLIKGHRGWQHPDSSNYDSSYQQMITQKHDITLVDTPGEKYLKNLSNTICFSNAAILVVDARHTSDQVKLLYKVYLQLCIAKGIK